MAAFIVPYMFIFNPGMLLIGKTTDIIQVIITSLVGTYALACGVQGWLWGRPISVAYRIPLLAAAITLIHPGVLTDLVGIAVLAGTIVVHRLLEKKPLIQSASDLSKK
ncbi:MAG: hypothetical protein QME78_17075 [Thermodesulfobacteriota bacterium]|nr:hypothetical protein [Thermodesulfobacteriota bacterium]